jgi:hypothetical protein
MNKPGPKKGTRPSGREKGTPNKRSLELLQGLIAHGCSPAGEIASLLLSSQLQAKDKLECWERLLPYLYPQQKAIDPDGYITIEQAAGMLGAEVAKFKRILEAHVTDPMTVAAIIEALRGTQGT